MGFGSKLYNLMITARQEADKQLQANKKAAEWVDRILLGMEKRCEEEASRGYAGCILSVADRVEGSGERWSLSDAELSRMAHIAVLELLKDHFLEEGLKVVVYPERSLIDLSWAECGANKKDSPASEPSSAPVAK